MAVVLRGWGRDWRGVGIGHGTCVEDFSFVVFLFPSLGKVLLLGHLGSGYK